MKLVIIDYGAGNIKSIQFAFGRLGVETSLSSNKETIMAADRVIFPGVGEASSAMHMLLSHELNTIIPKLKQPVLGICLGMQLLCQHTEEGYTDGLGIFQTKVKRFATEQNIKVPQIGWNTVENVTSNLFKGIPEQAFMYLVHSYYAEICPETIATTTYGTSYTSALQHNNFYGVQFHPEKSGEVGSKLLANFLEL
ncbi:imidazole glycerol phosphate synthase subunit HisH [Mangrovimonas sp. DI 80]|uniref:imidazole glycerol phosphate synthase subunit HisH n=1 Tax=Mangrovimonas sp. DI 80 TaxID=1779330 RepID=UPI000976E9D9|nr:imidazole glycerol phosphate synthase subunit HisH [Mangrovimonas sp. DI 80]OMP30716.1 imidazole glycerol phosphate synthase subunit HisH [Mangrovimonas sp. DI 80]